MQFLLDNLTAIIVSGIVLLGLQVTQARSQHAGVEGVATHSAKTKTLAFGEWVEDDVLSIGANFGTNLYRFEEPILDSDGNASSWTFYSDSTRHDGTETRVFKRWRMVPTGTATFTDVSYDVFKVERDSVVLDYPSAGIPPTLSSINPSDWVLSTWSIGTVSFFTVDLLDRMGERPTTSSGATDLEAVDYIRVRFGVVPEYRIREQHATNRDYVIRELYWAKTLKVRPYWVPPPSQS